VFTVGLKNVVSGNTYLRNTGQAVSVLDLVLTDSPYLINSLILEDPLGSSPHGLVSFKIDISTKVVKTYLKTSWQYHRADWDGLCSFLQNSDWTLGDNVNLAWGKVKSNIISGMESFIPKYVIKRNVNDKPWFTDKCAIACSNRKKAWHQYKVSPQDPTKLFT
jgi:hypothetical protein